MQKNVKRWLMTAASLVVIGCLMFAVVMTILKWDFTKLSTVKYETNTYQLNETFRSISVVADTADIVFAVSNDEACRVVCHESENAKHTVSVEDDILIIAPAEARKWYEYIGISFGKPKITIYIPQGNYSTLSINTQTGDVEMPKDFSFESIRISATTGHITNAASASGHIVLKASTGDIFVQNISAGALDLSVSTGKVTVTGANCEGDVRIEVSTGKVSMTDIRCKSLISDGDTGDISLTNVIANEAFSIERDTGDVKLDGCDAAEISIKTDTGDVTGSLLSSKVFITQTDTGNVHIPKSTTGGKCEIATDTGDIKITLN